MFSRFGFEGLLNIASGNSRDGMLYPIEF